MAIDMAQLLQNQLRPQQAPQPQIPGNVVSARDFEVPQGHQQLMNQIAGIARPQPSQGQGQRFIGSQATAPQPRNFGLPMFSRPQASQFGGGGSGFGSMGFGAQRPSGGGYFGGSQLNPVLEFLRWLSQGGFAR